MSHLLRCRRWYGPFATLIALGLMSGPGKAATLHVVLVPDTRAPDIGKDMRINADLIEVAFRANIPADQLNLVTVGSAPGERLDRDAVLRAIYALPVQPDDSVMYFSCGHGAYNPNPTPQGEAAGTYTLFSGNDTILYQSEVRGAIARLRPKLSVVILDCCNPLRPIRTPPFAASMAPAQPVTMISPLFSALFFQPSGTIVLESSAPGQYAFVKPTVGDPDGQRIHQGSLFTLCFSHVLRVNAQQTFDWSELRRRTQQEVTLGFRELVRSRHLVLQGPGEAVAQTDQTVTVVLSDLR